MAECTLPKIKFNNKGLKQKN